jgi:serine-type D-Ala-D-Ala carboxypeptidase/endopeptidase (penicillin-binding protein 4)
MILRFLALALLVPATALAQTPSLLLRVEAKLAEAPKGTRIGLVVADETGREIVAILPDQRFIPASNTKMVTTAAALAWPADDPLIIQGARVWLTGQDVVLTGYGDPRLSAAPDCRVDCLATLADAVAAKTKIVRDITGDATWFADMRWSGGMSWNNIPTESGTANSALTLDDNEVPLMVTAGAVGAPPSLTPTPYFTIDNRAVTVATGPTTLDYFRLPFERTVHLIGTVARDAPPQRLRLGIDDPAHYAAWTFRRMLQARGVRVSGTVRSLYRPVGEPDRMVKMPPPLAALDAPPLAEDVVIINKVSQNLHAELLWRQMGRAKGDSSPLGDVAVVHALLQKAGLPRTAYDFADGSGMSTYNRISPRGMVTLLRWAMGQPWGKAWRDSFPVGGVDGTTAGRFKGTSLEGRIFAKTGSINAVAALSGYMTAKSGRTFAFSILANDIPDGASARPAMDATLVLIAESN